MTDGTPAAAPRHKAQLELRLEPNPRGTFAGSKFGFKVDVVEAVEVSFVLNATDLDLTSASRCE